MGVKSEHKAGTGLYVHQWGLAGTSLMTAVQLQAYNLYFQLTTTCWFDKVGASVYLLLLKR
ncbi:hypothetical protein ACIL82_12085 [Enterococcus faecium]